MRAGDPAAWLALKRGQVACTQEQGIYVGVLVVVVGNK